MRLPLRERVLNAWAAGFSMAFIAERLKCHEGTVRNYVRFARRENDPRAISVDRRISLGRGRGAAQRLLAEIRDLNPRDAPDQFPDLPEISAPILPFGGRIPQALEEP
jgi:hypothetical protein